MRPFLVINTIIYFSPTYNFLFYLIPRLYAVVVNDLMEWM